MTKGKGPKILTINIKNVRQLSYDEIKQKDAAEQKSLILMIHYPARPAPNNFSFVAFEALSSIPPDCTFYVLEGLTINSLTFLEWTRANEPEFIEGVINVFKLAYSIKPPKPEQSYNLKMSRDFASMQVNGEFVSHTNVPVDEELFSSQESQIGCLPAPKLLVSLFKIFKKPKREIRPDTLQNTTLVLAPRLL